MAGHGVGLERVHDFDHVAAERLLCGIGALPGIATIKQQNIIVAALGTDMFDDRRHPVETAHPAVGLRKCGEIQVGHRICVRRTRFDIVELQEVGAGDVRRQTGDRSDAEIDRRLAEIDRLELGMNVGDVEDR